MLEGSAAEAERVNKGHPPDSLEVQVFVEERTVGQNHRLALHLCVTIYVGLLR